MRFWRFRIDCNALPNVTGGWVRVLSEAVPLFRWTSLPGHPLAGPRERNEHNLLLVMARATHAHPNLACKDTHHVSRLGSKPKNASANRRITDTGNCNKYWHVRSSPRPRPRRRSTARRAGRHVRRGAEACRRHVRAARSRATAPPAPPPTLLVFPHSRRPRAANAAAGADPPPPSAPWTGGQGPGACRRRGLASAAWAPPRPAGGRRPPSPPGPPAPSGAGRPPGSGAGRPRCCRSTPCPMAPCPPCSGTWAWGASQPCKVRAAVWLRGHASGPVLDNRTLRQQPIQMEYWAL